jgi:hypothetical protein
MTLLYYLSPSKERERDIKREASPLYDSPLVSLPLTRREGYYSPFP